MLQRTIDGLERGGSNRPSVFRRMVDTAHAWIEGAHLGVRRSDPGSKPGLAQQRPEEPDHGGLDVATGESVERLDQSVEEFRMGVVRLEHATDALQHVPRTGVGAW